MNKLFWQMRDCEEEAVDEGASATPPPLGPTHLPCPESRHPYLEGDLAVPDDIRDHERDCDRLGIANESGCDIDHHRERERERGQREKERERDQSSGTYPAKESCTTVIYDSNENEGCANVMIYETGLTCSIHSPQIQLILTHL